MTRDRCPSADQWARLADGELTANETARLERHAVACPTCRAAHARARELAAALASSVPARSASDSAAAILRRIDAGEVGADPAPGRSRTIWLAGGLASAVAAAAAVIVLLARGGSVQSESEFRPRGGTLPLTAAESIERRVGVELFAVGDPPRRLEPGQRVSPATAYTGAYRNLETEAVTYLLLFAVDAEGEVHWLYPAYTDVDDNPRAIRLPAADQSTAFSDTVVFERVPAGPLHVIALLSRRQLAVSDIESLLPDQRTIASLRARFPEAHIDDTALEVEP